jgi:small subunit ribosomal protein S4
VAADPRRLEEKMLKVGPRHRICRRVGAPVCGRPNCPSGRRPYPPGQHGRGRRRLTEYQLRLLEKQKLRAIYGVGERQLRKYFAKATRKKGVTGAELLRLLETRLDAIALRLGFALSMRAARQLVSHGHVRINGRRIDVPSAGVRPGDVIELTDQARNFISVREALAISPEPPSYLERNADALTGTLTRWPERQEIPLPVELDERLIVEHYA